MRITSKGQVTIPLEVREQFGFLPNTEIEFVLQGNSVFIRKAESKGTRGTKIIEHLQGKATVKMTTEQILKLTRQGT